MTWIFNIRLKIHINGSGWDAIISEAFEEPKGKWSPELVGLTNKQFLSSLVDHNLWMKIEIMRLFREIIVIKIVYFQIKDRLLYFLWSYTLPPNISCSWVVFGRVLSKVCQQICAYLFWVTFCNRTVHFVFIIYLL